MMRQSIFGLIMGILTALPINSIFEVHPIACFFMGIFAVGFWQLIYVIWVGNPILG